MNKKWLWSCGCFSVLALCVLLLITMLSWTSCNALLSGSSDASKRLFGGPVPSGFLAAGIPVGSKVDDESVVILFHAKSRAMLFAERMQGWTPETIAEVQSGGEVALIKMLRRAYNMDATDEVWSEGQAKIRLAMETQLAKESAGKEAEEKAEEKVEKSLEIKQQYVFFFRVYDQDEYIPVVMTLLPQADVGMVALVAAGVFKGSHDAKRDFKYEYKHMAGLLETLVQQTALHRLTLPVSPELDVLLQQQSESLSLKKGAA